MVVYTSAKCGHCGISWTTLNPNTPNTVFGKIGPPVIKCGSCLKDNNTGLKFIKDLNFFEKLLFVDFKSIFGIILSIVFIGLGGFILYNMLLIFQDGEMDTFLICFGAIMGGYFSYLGISGLINNISFNKDVNTTEILFKKNGGFIWSYEMYPPN